VCKDPSACADVHARAQQRTPETVNRLKTYVRFVNVNALGATYAFAREGAERAPDRVIGGSEKQNPKSNASPVINSDCTDQQKDQDSPQVRRALEGLTE